MSGRRRRRRIAADAGFQHWQVRWAQPAQGVLFQPSPQPFVRVEFGGVGGQAIHAQAIAVLGQGGAGSPRAMRVAAVPEQKQKTGDLPQQMPDKANHLATSDGARHQVQIDMWVGRHGGDRRQFRPTEAVAQDRSLAPRRPGAAGGGQQREAALVHKGQRGLQSLGIFLRRGQVCSTQRRMAFSSRSRARPLGFCQLQRNPWSKRHT